MSDPSPVRKRFPVAPVVLAIYLALLARIERITPRSVLRTIRGVPDEDRPR